MKTPRRTLAGLLVTALGLIWCNSAESNPTPVKPTSVVPKPAPVQSAPQPGQSFGDWGTRCFPVTSGAPCDMFQMLVNSRSKERVMSVSITYAPSRSQYLIQIAVPLEVALRHGVIIQTSSYRSGPLAYRRCTDACLVETVIDRTTLAAMGRAAGTGSVIVADRFGRQVPLRLSLNGFSAAVAAMTALNESRVH